MIVLTAPDNGRDQFRQAEVVSTAADGTWVARLRPGPSRLVEAVYQGTQTTEPTVSGQVRVVVPAKLKLLRVSPRRVAWGHTVRITGRLLGVISHPKELWSAYASAADPATRPTAWPNTSPATVASP